MADERFSGDDPEVAGRLFLWGFWGGLLSRSVIRFLSQYSGLPGILVAGLLLVVGFRVIRKTMRFLVEVAVVTAALFAASQLGLIRW